MLNREIVQTEADGKYRFEDEYVAERGKYYLRDMDYKGSYSEKLDYAIEAPDGTVLYSGGRKGKPNTWRWSKDKFERGIKNGYVVFDKKRDNWKVYIKQYQYADNSGNPYERTLPYRALIEFLNGQGSNDFNSIMETNAFSFPKSVGLLRHLLKIASARDSVILDFFSGSATTAHAVMQSNAEDGGSRKFIMVQLPELCGEKSEAYKSGYKNICEIGKERIRRAAKKIAEDHPNAKFDGGFRVLKVDSSNMKDVYYAPADYHQNMLAGLESNIKEDRSDLDLLFGCLTEWGLMLSLPHKTEIIGGCAVHDCNDGDLIACFAENIPAGVIESIAKRRPLRAVFRDAGFANSPSKINVTEIFKEMAPETSVKVI